MEREERKEREGRREGRKEVGRRAKHWAHYFDSLPSFVRCLGYHSLSTPRFRSPVPRSSPLAPRFCSLVPWLHYKCKRRKKRRKGGTLPVETEGRVSQEREQEGSFTTKDERILLPSLFPIARDYHGLWTVMLQSIQHLLIQLLWPSIPCPTVIQSKNTWMVAKWRSIKSRIRRWMTQREKVRNEQDVERSLSNALTPSVPCALLSSVHFYLLCTCIFCLVK